jgi:protein-tyrosine phosphatase
MTSSFDSSNVSGSLQPPQGRGDREGVSVLFVCLGNICRSPMAEGVFRHRAREAGAEDLRVDSAGTGAWHAGEPPDPRSVAVARRHGVILEGRARQVEALDFQRFTLIVAMDADNLRELERQRAVVGGGAELRLLREWDPEAGAEREVPDPYYGGTDGFLTVFEMVDRSCRALLEEVLEGGAGR